MVEREAGTGPYYRMVKPAADTARTARRLALEPPMHATLFENPWVPVVVLVALGAVLRTAGRRASRPRLVAASWAAYAAAVGLVGLAAAVNTDREQIAAHTKAMLVSAEAAASGGAANARARPFATFFTPQVVVQGPGGAVWDTTHAAGLTNKLRQHRVRGTSLRRVDIAPVPGNADAATTQMRVASRVGEGYPAPTTWEVGWLRTADGWRINRLRWLELRDQPPRPALYY